MSSYCFNFPYEDALEHFNKNPDLENRLVAENEDGNVTSGALIIPFEVYKDILNIL